MTSIAARLTPFADHQEEREPVGRDELDAGRFLKPYARPLIRNAWYCAAWSTEVSEALFPRRILNVPVLLYRKEGGEAVALLDICPHKLAPMHMGERVGDAVRCGYHGLEFNSDGACIRNPQGNGQIPTEAKLRKFPLIERNGVLWIWMGDAERADNSEIRDFHHLDDKSLRTVKGGHHVNCNYVLLLENLLDLGHALFLHKVTGGLGDKYVLNEHKVNYSERSLTDLRLYRNVSPPGPFAHYVPAGVDRVDYSSDIHWTAPSTLVAINACASLGDVRGKSALTLIGSHLITPETQHSMHYFYAHSRNYAQADFEVDEGFRRWQRDALDAEDSRIAQAIDGVLTDAKDLNVRMVMLNTDQSGMRANRILDRLVALEAN